MQELRDETVHVQRVFAEQRSDHEIRYPSIALLKQSAHNSLPVSSAARQNQRRLVHLSPIR